MKKSVSLIILLLTCRICIAQNLVPNGDFEQYSGCPGGTGQIDSASFWTYASAYEASYFNICGTGGTHIPNTGIGYQQPHSGNAFASIITYYQSLTLRSYLEVSLIAPLINNECYHFEMYVNLADKCSYTTDAVQIYFSDTLIKNNSQYLLTFTPQISNTSGVIYDTLNWTLISGDYLAHGGESYLLIGNFFFTSGILLNWGVLSDCEFFVDDVSLIPSPCTGIEEQNENYLITILPNPVTEKLNVTIDHNELFEIILYDIAARKILQTKFTGSVSLDIQQLKKGIYIYELKNNPDTSGGIIKKGKVVKQ